MKILKLLSVLVSVAMASSAWATNLSLDCYKAAELGSPVVHVDFYSSINQSEVAVREYQYSKLTGGFELGPKLKQLPKTQSGIFVFDLGYYYTVDFSLVVEEKLNGLEVSFVEYDRDDASGRVEKLVCK